MAAARHRRSGGGWRARLNVTLKCKTPSHSLDARLATALSDLHQRIGALCPGHALRQRPETSPEALTTRSCKAPRPACRHGPVVCALRYSYHGQEPCAHALEAALEKARLSTLAEMSLQVPSVLFAASPGPLCQISALVAAHRPRVRPNLCHPQLLPLQAHTSTSLVARDATLLVCHTALLLVATALLHAQRRARRAYGQVSQAHSQCTYAGRVAMALVEQESSMDICHVRGWKVPG